MAKNAMDPMMGMYLSLESLIDLYKNMVKREYSRMVKEAYR
jgi:hypothetical protein